MSTLANFLSELARIRAFGVQERSFYPPIAGLMTEVGRELKPKVRCITELKGLGADHPDAGLFSDDICRRLDDDAIRALKPDRGVIEVKPPSHDARKVARTEQVGKYLDGYGLVLVTTMREFLLVDRGPGGTLRELEHLALAPSEDAFWNEVVAHPLRAQKRHGELLVEFLRRALLYRAPIESPQDVAGLLASYAREARARMDAAESNLDAFQGLRKTLSEGLGLQFDGDKGEHFFRSTLVQTLFYGLFSAWVLWRRAQPEPAPAFDRRIAADYLHVPVLRKLFYEVAEPGAMRGLGLGGVLDLAAAALNRVRWTEFQTRFAQSDAVVYFYEPFLHAFDPELRKDLGVWYTPPEIVRYMVERVDRVLRQELSIADGLADPRVLVLDPCCGTGAYVVEVLRRIAQTLSDNGAGGLLGARLKQAAIHQVHGFEILPAPYVIAHWQVAALLAEHGVALGDGERGGVLLTNALTDWGPAPGVRETVSMKEMEEEREQARAIKHDRRILVVLGNPPYNAFAGTSPEQEQGLVDPYKEGLARDWGIRKFNLDDLYVRFFRLAERRVAEMTGEGVVCFISNHSWIGDPSFVVMRKRLLNSFDAFWIENMHGNRKASEYAPDGRTSETVFAIPGVSTGIQQGVAISLWSRRKARANRPIVRFRDDIDSAKAVERRAQLLSTLEEPDFDERYTLATPCDDNRWSFRPEKVEGPYRSWPRVTELCAIAPMNGLMEKRRGSLMSLDREVLVRRMKSYCDRSIPWERLAAVIPDAPGLLEDAARFDASRARQKILDSGGYHDDGVQRYVLRPFDSCWVYYSGVRPLWNEPRPSLKSHCWPGNGFLVSRMKAARDDEGHPFLFVRGLSDDHILTPDASCFPLRIRTAALDGGQLNLPGVSEAPTTANLSDAARGYLDALGITNLDGSADMASLIWMHALAIGYAPAYLAQNADGIRQDWPRIPLPAVRELLEASAALGRQVAALLDTEAPVDGVTSGSIRPELRDVARPERIDGGNLDPAAGDLEVTAGWGHAGREGVCMPGRGKVVTPDDGGLDVFWSPQACWRNVPAPVWNFTIGGYQVLKKWLSYRERDILGRALHADETAEFQRIARRIAALVALAPALDDNYRAAAESHTQWPTKASN